VRSPYGFDPIFAALVGNPFAASGYHVVLPRCRSRFGSGGAVVKPWITKDLKAAAQVRHLKSGTEYASALQPTFGGDGVTRIVVTGGSGKLGSACVADLISHAYDVVVFDLVRSAALPQDFTFVPVDLTDYGQVLDAMLGVEERYDQVDALVHLAAIPAPGIVSNHATFANNMNATWNIVTGARRAGVKNIVWASSETVLGLPFDTPPPYVPVDEDYPPRPESTYSLVKTLEEAIAAQLCRWDPELKMFGLRFSNVMRPEDYVGFADFQHDAALRKWNLWGYIDARDGAQAIRLALESDLTGCEIFVIANADTVMERSNTELLAEWFSDVDVRGEIGLNDTLLSIDKARRLLGYEPQHSWRNEVTRTT
jgi:nucleoside-diphosphate-sugar epimerase